MDLNVTCFHRCRSSDFKLRAMAAASSCARAHHLLLPSAGRSTMPLGRPSEAHSPLTDRSSGPRRTAITSPINTKTNPRDHRSWSRTQRTPRCRRRRRCQIKETTTQSSRPPTVDIDAAFSPASRQRSHGHSGDLCCVLVPICYYSYMWRIWTTGSVAAATICVVVRTCSFSPECGGVLGVE